ncbi:MAG: hypothetical protein J5970_02855 [Bacilli bacterium]|nr:hypothetical protein [Bacilli bacterium]
MELNKETLKQNDFLIDLLVDNLVIDNASVRIDNIVGIKKQISNIDTMTRILEDSKRLNERIYTRKTEILLYLLGKAKELNYDLALYDFPVPKHSYYALDLSNAENIIENELLSANTNEDKIEVVKDCYNGILEQQISSYSNIINRKLDSIIPPSESQKRINEIVDEMHNNKVDIKDFSDINEYATKLQESTEKDNQLFNQMLDVMDNEYQKLEKEYEQLPKVENVSQLEVKNPNVDVDKLISDIDKKLEELDKEKENVKMNNENEIINTITNKIKELPLNTEITIAELIGYNPQVNMVDPLTQGMNYNKVKAECEKNGIVLEENSDEIGGLGYYYKFKKINSKSNLERFNEMFEVNENGRFKKLIIPVHEPSNQYENELNLIDKNLSECTIEESTRAKLYSDKLFYQLPNEDRIKANRLLMTQEEFKYLFESDESGAFIRLVIPAYAVESGNSEIDLRGKKPTEFTQDEVITMKKYAYECSQQYLGKR